MDGKAPKQGGKSNGNVGSQKLGKQNGKERACISIPALHLKKFKCKFQSSRQNETKKFTLNAISTLTR